MPLGWTEDQRNCFVEKIDQSVKEAVVNCRKQGDGLGEEEVEWTGEGDSEEFVQTFSAAGVHIKGRLSRLKILFLHLLPDTFGLVLENSRVAGLGNRGDQHHPHAAGHSHKNPENPAPAEIQPDVPCDH